LGSCWDYGCVASVDESSVCELSKTVICWSFLALDLRILFKKINVGYEPIDTTDSWDFIVVWLALYELTDYCFWRSVKYI